MTRTTDVAVEFGDSYGRATSSISGVFCLSAAGEVQRQGAVQRRSRGRQTSIRTIASSQSVSLFLDMFAKAFQPGLIVNL
jgi:hypothetical protein